MSGFLTSEQHPEIGPSGHGITNYTYDASGNPLSKDVAGSSDFQMRYRYDPANRLIAVDQATGPSSVRPIKSFHYAHANDGADLRAGKLVLSKRINWVDPVNPLPNALTGATPVTVSQAYRYEGRDGRVSKRQTRYSLANDHYAFDTGFAYDPLGNLSSLSYPRCLHPSCAGQDAARTVAFHYTRGFLSSVPGFAPDLDYQLGGMLHKVVHANGVTETIETSSKNFQRPHQITTTGVTTGGWDSGVYTYDGSGNIKQVGSQLFQYDRMSRLLSGQVSVGGQLRTQSMTYDGFGDISSLTTNGSILATPVEAAKTNRLQNATYDAGGNLTDLTLGGETTHYDYDALNMMKTLQSTTDQARIFIYDADDERILTTDCAFVQCATQQPLTTVTVRGLDGKVLRVYERPKGNAWIWKRDYVYRDGQLLASVERQPGGGEKVSHLHLDHLGSPRQITDENGAQEAFHSYYPFGEEATDSGQDGRALKFTGHERDVNGGGGGALDYMHARYCSPDFGRFLSTDPKQRRKATTTPQKMNRYSYAIGNPAKYVDPDGRDLFLLYDFRNSGLSGAQQTHLAVSVRRVFASAGVRNVQAFFEGGRTRPRIKTAADRLVKIKVTQADVVNNRGEPVYGKTELRQRSATVSTSLTPKGADGLTLLINIVGHEAGHASGALPKYDNDGFPLNTPINPRGAEPGTVMEQGVSPEELEARIRYFSTEDAESLRQTLNPKREE